MTPLSVLYFCDGINSFEIHLEELSCRFTGLLGKLSKAFLPFKSTLSLYGQYRLRSSRKALDKGNINRTVSVLVVGRPWTRPSYYF